MNCDCKYCDPWMITADSLSAQNQIREFNPDSTTHSPGEPVIECDPSLSDTTSQEGEVQDHIVSLSESEVDYSSVEEEDEEEDVYIPPILDDDELNNPPDPRLELVDRQFNLRMKELFTQTSSGQLVPITIEATLQQTTDASIQHLTKSHALTWVSQFKTTPEEDELPLWMSIMKDDIDVLVTHFQQQMYRRFSKVMSEMVKLYHKYKTVNNEP